MLAKAVERTRALSKALSKNIENFKKHETVIVKEKKRKKQQDRTPSRRTLAKGRGMPGLSRHWYPLPSTSIPRTPFRFIPTFLFVI